MAVVTARSPRPDGGSRRREELLAAARFVIGRDGVTRATTRAIAAHAGVPLGAIHYWFASRDDLLEAVVLDHVARITAVAADAAAEQDPDPQHRLEASLRAAMQRELDFTVSERLATYELTSWALRTPGREDVAARLYASMRRGSEALCEPFLPPGGDPDGPDAAALAMLLVALIDGLALARLADPTGTPVDAVIRLAARALSPVRGCE